MLNFFCFLRILGLNSLKILFPKRYFFFLAFYLFFNDLLMFFFAFDVLFEKVDMHIELILLMVEGMEKVGFSGGEEM